MKLNLVMHQNMISAFRIGWHTGWHTIGFFCVKNHFDFLFENASARIPVKIEVIGVSNGAISLVSKLNIFINRNNDRL